MRNEANKPTETPERGRFGKHRRRWASSRSALMRWVFSSSAVFTIIALGLIIFFLIKESAGFFRLYNESLSHYRLSGLEYTDLLKQRHKAHIEISHGLTTIRSDWIETLRKEGISDQDLRSTIQQPAINELLIGYRTALDELRSYIDQKIQIAITHRNELITPGQPEESSEERLGRLRAGLDEYTRILSRLDQKTSELFQNADDFSFGDSRLNHRLAELREADQQLHQSKAAHLRELKAWNPDKPLPQAAALRAFITGKKWAPASDQQNWFGLLPLLTGSLLVCSIALLIAIPTGIGSAIYVNQIAHPGEQALIKPYIEFIAALPSVVLGFFGVMVFGEFVRDFSRIDWLQWLPFFPIHERLNAFTAGSLLGLMAIPTIFTLTEEALNGVSNNLKEASYAIGATRLQTTWRTIIPSAFPGIISAIMLGFGRVIGETMVVLLCAGNRVKIPEVDSSLSALFEPIHTMTGMIAQEMGEVVYGSLHYRALFIVGIVLFSLSLIVNYTAQSLLRRQEDKEPY